MAKATILGSGTSFGVPVVGCSCDVCTSHDPRDRRTRTSGVVETEDGTRILIDTPPELRLQLIGARVARVDAVLYTHDHADHVHGIDDLRAMSVANGPLELYGAADVLERIANRFRYIFDDAVRPPRGTSKPELVPVPVASGRPIPLGGLSVIPLEFDHGTMTVYGYRFGDFAYLTDVKKAPPQSRKALTGVRYLVVNALFEKTHPTHLSIPEAIALAHEIGAERTYLTHLTHRYSHEALKARLPDDVEPAYDGLVIEW